MACKVTFFWFQAMEKLAGFTETFWNVNGTLAGAFSDAQNLGSALNQLHGRQTVLQNIRVSNALNLRDTTNFPQALTIPAPQGDGADSDYVNTGALLVLKSASTPPAPSYTTRQWVRSLWDAWVDKGGRLQSTAQFTGAANPFYLQLVGTPSTPSNWRMRVLDKSILKKRVTNITLQGVVTCPAHGYPDQSIVRISGARGMTNVNRVWIITVIDVNTFQLANASGIGGALVSNAKPMARLQSPIFVPITSAAFVRATSHKSGRPTGQLGGRRRKPA